MWFKAQPNGKDIQNCVTFFASSGQFIDESCSYKSCSVCAWKNEPAFTLRGLDKCKSIDGHYVYWNRNILY